MSGTVTAFIIVLVLALAFFAYSCFRRFGLVVKGKPDNRFDNLPKRVGNMLFYAFGQRRVVKKPFGINHFVLFWAFIILLISNTEFLLGGLLPIPSASPACRTALFYPCFGFRCRLLQALLSVIMAVIRRFFFPPPYTDARSRDAFIILGMVAGLMLAFFGMNACEIAGGVDRAGAYMPVANLIAGWLPQGAAGLDTAAQVFWWLHAIILLAFLNYLPYSKHMHVLTSIPNCFFKSLEKVKTQPREEFKKGNTFGVGQVEEFTWKGLFDSYACTECGRCSDNCPATFTGKPLQPRLVIHDIKMNLLKNAAKDGHPELPLIGAGVEGSVAEDVIWECTTCGACMEVCPVFIEHVPRIVDMRRNLVEMKAKFPEELLTLFENMEQRSNPWGIAPADRIKWAADIEVKPFEKDKTEYSSTSAAPAPRRAQPPDDALPGQILDKAVLPGVLWAATKCAAGTACAASVTSTSSTRWPKTLSRCSPKGREKDHHPVPALLFYVKNDYKQYGADFEVIHHTELINSLIQQGKLRLNAATDAGTIVFHDSCYLGRYNGIFEAPRQVIAAATGQAPTEMDRRLDKGFCCGAGGGRMWMEEKEGSLINVARVEEALTKKPDTICVCCPYCMTMFDDGLKDKDAADKVQVQDLAETSPNLCLISWTYPPQRL
jgi:Fe-S oxidoreductase/nitrate reductase gamma subunit